jgi:hypothetical protein
MPKLEAIENSWKVGFGTNPTIVQKPASYPS